MVTESGTAIFESDAIIEYVRDQYGEIDNNIDNEQRALERAWSYLGSKNYLPQCGAMSSKNEQTFQERASKLITAFTKVEEQLTAEQPFFNSLQLSNVDIAWLPLLHRAHIVKQETGYDFLCGLAKAQAWQAQIMDSGIVEKTVSEDFEQLFKDFYLSNTYLGEGKDVAQSYGSASVCC